MLPFLGVNNWSSSFPIVEKKTLKVSAFLESSKTYSFCSFIVGPIRVVLQIYLSSASQHSKIPCCHF